MNNSQLLLSIKKTNLKKKFIIEDDDEINLNELLKLYKNAEFLPINIINTIIPTVFTSYVMLHEYSSCHKIIKIKVKDLLSSPITNWKYNRPADPKRCYDIAKYIYNSKNNMDTMLYLNFNNLEQTFDIIDGVHRYTALKLIKEHNSKQLDLICEGDFGNNGDAKWLYESYIIVNIRFNSLEGDIIELFKSLNKSSPIPELYIRDVSKYKRDVIEEVVKNFQFKYNSHFTASNKPNKPNINRDRFIDLLEIVFEKYKISEENPLSLENILENFNTLIAFDISELKIPKNIKDKCLKSGCWLFIHSVEKLSQMI